MTPPAPRTTPSCTALSPGQRAPLAHSARRPGLPAALLLVALMIMSGCIDASPPSSSPQDAVNDHVAAPSNDASPDGISTPDLDVADVPREVDASETSLEIDAETRDDLDAWRDAPPSSAVDLVNLSLWSQADVNADPFPMHRPPVVECSRPSPIMEGDWLEMNTNHCPYFLITFDTIAPIEAGAVVSLQLLHQALASVEPDAEAHLAVQLDDALLWETSIAIPAAADLLDLTWTSPRAFDAGGRLVVHLHNHGANSWTITHVRTHPRS